MTVTQYGELLSQKEDEKEKVTEGEDSNKVKE